MKAMDIIDRVDLMEPNQYSPEQKLHWLSTLDGKLFNELVRPRHPEETAPSAYQSGQETLLIAAPYAEDIFILHGTADEIIPFEAARDFAEEQLMEFLPIPGADHRFRSQAAMEQAMKAMLEWFGF